MGEPVTCPAEATLIATRTLELNNAERELTPAMHTSGPSVTKEVRLGLT